ncbi:MAG TPA: cytochrome c1 [Casimicrobiaceae bacterium]|nr:cytochrome c1 [Casimicrobiaceae bacterium]
MDNKISRYLAAVLFLVSGAAGAAGAPEPRLESAIIDPRDAPSLQRGARTFVNHCVNCHSAKYMRYNRLVDLGLTEQQIADNLILTGRFVAVDGGSQFLPSKTGDTMQVAMRPQDAKQWFGTTPPDLSVEARVRGNQWLYNYFLAFYRDDRSTTGWNNLVFPNVAMPHVLWELQGVQKLVATTYDKRSDADAAAIGAKGLALVLPTPDHKWVVQTLAVDAPGSLSPAEYRKAIGDLVNFMAYVAEPSKLTRVRLGLVVLLFLGVLFVFAYWLKREYWKDLH